MAASDFERFGDGAYRAVVLAERLARDSGRALVGPEDLLVALARTDLEAGTALAAAGVSPDELADRVSEWSPVGPAVPQAHFSPSLHRAVQRANRFASQERADTVTGRHLLRGLLDGEDEVVWRVLLSLGLDPAALSPPRPGPSEPVARPVRPRRPRANVIHSVFHISR